MLRVVIPGEAMAQGSKRLGRARGTGRPIILDANPGFKSWRHYVATMMSQCGPPAPWTSAVFVRLRIEVTRPKAHFGTGRNAGIVKATAPKVPVTGLDTDKCLRAIYDAGTDAGWWRDDKQCSGLVVRVYAPRPSLVIEAVQWESEGELRIPIMNHLAANAAAGSEW